MKKLIFLFTVAVSVMVISCQDDDDGTNQDLLIGKWKLSQEFENGELMTSDPCDLQGVETFNGDGTGTSEFYEEDGNGGCVLPADGVDAGTWENLGNGSYKFTSADGSSDTDSVSFSGNTFSIEYSDTFDGQTIAYRDVYTRI